MRLLPVFLLALALALPARAVIIDSGDGTGNTGAPADDPGWNHVGTMSNLTAVYIGYGWVLTANHVTTGTFTLGGSSYSPDLSTVVRISDPLQEDPDFETDLKVMKLLTDPGLTPLAIRATAPAVGNDVIMGGYGQNRGSAWNGYDPPFGGDGWYWGVGRTLRWGTNKVFETGLDWSSSGGSFTIRYFTTNFDRGLPTAHEACAAAGDSGGPTFIKNGSTWELAGILWAVDSFAAPNDEVAGYARTSPPSLAFAFRSYAVDLSHYRAEILEITRPCADGADNDGDGVIDYGVGPGYDPGCDSAGDDSEQTEALECDNGLDDDGDLAVDVAEDPGCKDPTWTEDPACNDGVDNDGDGRTDYPHDPHCEAAWETQEAGSGGGCGLLGIEALLVLPLASLADRARRRLARARARARSRARS